MATRKTSIHRGLKQRTANRSEYDDTLLRHNQRQENRLQLELDQWEKAQRVVAKGLDKESQWFRQKNPVSGGQQRFSQDRSKRNSVADQNSSLANLVPDYEYRNRANYMAEAPSTDHASHPRQTNESSEGEQTHVDRQPNSSKSHAQRKSSKAISVGEKGLEQNAERRKSTQASRKISQHHQGNPQTRDVTDSATTERRHKTSADVTPREKKASSTTTAGITTTKESDAQASTTPKGGTHTSKQSRKTSTHHASSSTTTSTSTTTPTTTTTSKPDKPPPSQLKPTTPIPFVPSLDTLGIDDTDAYDPDDGRSVSPRLQREMTWDGRRRYCNVWDNLSAPKRTSNVRSVRDRLQQEFTQTPAKGTRKAKTHAVSAGRAVD